MYQKYQVVIPENFEPYWVGFILGDGSITQPHKNNTKRLTITLHSRDIDHLEKFKQYLNCDIPIQVREQEAVLAITRTALAESLARFGIVPNKTFQIITPSCLKHNRNFWRGLVDADGTLCWVGKTKPYIAIYGTYDICEQFLNHIKFIFPEYITNRKPLKNRSIWKIAFTHQMARKVIQYLYQSGDISLNRKMDFAMKLSCT